MLILTSFARFVRYLFESSKMAMELPTETNLAVNQTTLLGTRVSAVETRLDSVVESQNIAFARFEEESDGRLNET